MNAQNKPVPIGTKQEAIITPKEGYEVAEVVVINTATNETVPSELKKTSEIPAQWTCSFAQPAGSVSIRTSVKPILYSVTIEECDNCNIVLLDYSDAAEVELKASDNEANDETEEAAEDPANFNCPQHSVKNGADEALDVEDGSPVNTETDCVVPSESHEENEGKDVVESVEANNRSDDSEDKPESVEDNDNQNINESVDPNVTDDVSVVNNSSEPENEEDNSNDDNGISPNDQVYDAGEFEDDLKVDEPERISQDVVDKKNKLFWKWRDAYNAGKVKQKEFEDVKRKHMQFLDDISNGKIIVEE